MTGTALCFATDKWVDGLSSLITQRGWDLVKAYPLQSVFKVCLTCECIPHSCFAKARTLADESECGQPQ